VVTVHDLAFLRLPGTLTARGVRFHRRGLSLTRRSAGSVLVPSTFVRDELVDEGFQASRIVVAPHGAPGVAPRGDDDVDSILRSAGVRAPFLLFVGTREPRKGVETLLSAHRAARAEAPDLELVVAGPAGWGAAVTGASGVHVLGRVDDDTLDALYRRALLCALPSRYEGFGLPALEAMAHGCPVVISNIPPLVEVVGDAGVLVPVGDVDAWTEAITRLIVDDPRRAELAVQGRARAASFTWSASAHAHRLAYELARTGPSSTAAP
jgi:glycosyltransferase involved in cell wall biosynthesis